MYNTQVYSGQNNLGFPQKRTTYSCLREYIPEERIEDEDYLPLLLEEDVADYVKMQADRFTTIIESNLCTIADNQKKIKFLNDYLNKILKEGYGKYIFERVFRNLLTNTNDVEYSPRLFAYFLSQTNFFEENEELVKDCSGNILFEAVENSNFDLIRMFGKKPFKKLYDPNKRYGVDGYNLCHLPLMKSEDEKLPRCVIEDIGTNPDIPDNRGRFPIEFIIDNVERLLEVFADYCLSLKKEDREKSPTFRILKERFKKFFLKYWANRLMRQSKRRNPTPIFMKRIRPISEPTEKLKLPPFKELFPFMGKGKTEKSRNYGTEKMPWYAKRSLKKPVPPLADPSQNLGYAIDELDIKKPRTQKFVMA